MFGLKFLSDLAERGGFTLLNLSPYLRHWDPIYMPYISDSETFFYTRTI